GRPAGRRRGGARLQGRPGELRRGHAGCVPRHRGARREVRAQPGAESEVLVAKKKFARIGRYRILGELGRGAMGIVYRAEDPNLDRVVALKTIILSDDAEGRKDYHKRFFVEAKAAGKLTHPHIVTTYDFGEEGDLAYLAMELLEGTDLRERLHKAPLPTADAVDIASQVADGPALAREPGGDADARFRRRARAEEGSRGALPGRNGDGRRPAQLPRRAALARSGRGQGPRPGDQDGEARVHRRQGAAGAGGARDRLR